MTPENATVLVHGFPFVVGCVSDTHIPVRTRALPAGLLRELGGVDLILHAGDLVSLGVLQDLGRLAPVLAVAGNMDPEGVSERLPEALLVEAGGWRLGLTHGAAGDAPTTPERALEAFTAGASSGPPDVVVFGHSHQPLCERRGPVLLLNPGSPTDRRFASRLSCGILTLPGPGAGREPRGEIRWLD